MLEFDDVTVDPTTGSVIVRIRAVPFEGASAGSAAGAKERAPAAAAP
jgi:hypothetical protein